MPDVVIAADLLKKAIGIYLALAYPNGSIPEAVRGRLAGIETLGPDEMVPISCFEVGQQTSGQKIYALRLGQPIYPHMKLIVEPCPTCGPSADGSIPLLFRADAHDSHLHAPPGSPDAAPLAALRASNKQLTDAIETAWASQGLPTFREFLRSEIARRKACGCANGNTPSV